MTRRFRKQHQHILFSKQSIHYGFHKVFQDKNEPKSQGWVYGVLPPTMEKRPFLTIMIFNSKETKLSDYLFSSLSFDSRSSQINFDLSPGRGKARLGEDPRRLKSLNTGTLARATLPRLSEVHLVSARLSHLSEKSLAWARSSDQILGQTLSPSLVRDSLAQISMSMNRIEPVTLFEEVSLVTHLLLGGLLRRALAVVGVKLVKLLSFYTQMWITRSTRLSHMLKDTCRRLRSLNQVDLNRSGYKDEPFILASYAQQVFYVSDPTNKKWSIVLLTNKIILNNIDHQKDIDVEDDPFLG
ncbi:hypothetical protein Lal_00012205 [Lupinus albus]|nr:hypothetical protein Lal_00012205 [Lupinus albus]